MHDHEYALIAGINRSRIGRYITILASSVSALVVLVILYLVDLARILGVSANIPPSIMSLVGAGMVFTLLYWIFDRHAWKWKHADRFLKVPDLSGEWVCEGASLHEDGSVKYPWQGDVTIAQTWDKIRVRLKTKQSGSNSITAALINDDIDGFRLLYNYRNDPRPDEPELRSHHGFAELVFTKDLQSAEGHYYNGHGRVTFGRMKLRKV